MKNFDINNVVCQILTKDKIDKMDKILDELQINNKQLRKFIEYPQNLGFIAFYEDEIIGFIYGYSLMSMDNDLITDLRHQLFIYSVDVVEKYQKKGVGSLLFQYVVDYSKENDFSECFVITDKGNKAACKIYEKAGLKNDYIDEIVYVKKHNKSKVLLD